MRTDQKVSTMAACFFPILSLYQYQASGLMGSPTEPRTRMEDKS